MSLISRLFGRKTEPSEPADPIDAFWHWWRRASPELTRAYNSGKPPSDALVETLSRRVDAIDENLEWETGPGTRSEHHFALSAAGNPELRVLTQRWLSRAPKPDEHWEYYAARQASGVDPKIRLSLDGRDFMYGDFTLAMERDDTRSVVHLAVHHPHFTEMKEEDRSTPAFLFLDDLLGEDGVATWVGAVETPAQPPENASSPGALKELLQLVREAWDDNDHCLLEGTRGGAPVIAVVRLSLKRLDYLMHDHHLRLTLELLDPRDDGLQSAEEGDELAELELAQIEALGHRVVWIGHETCGGQRVIHFHADSSPGIQDELLAICEAHGGWQTELSVTHDPAWSVLSRF